MGLVTNLFLVFTVHYIIRVVKLLFSSSAQKHHKKKRSDLEYYRSKPKKTIQEQKEFLRLKHGDMKPFVWSWKNVFKVVKTLVSYIALFLVIRTLWYKYVGLEVPLWFALAYFVLFPIAMNKLLSNFGLESDDIRLFLGGKKK